MKILYIFISVFFLSTASSSAQSLTAKEIEDDLVHEYSRLISFGENYDIDSVDYQDSVFRNKIAAYTKQYPFTLTYPFKTLIDSCNINIVTSDDGFFRIYSWDTRSGGTMYFFNNIFQFKSGNNVYANLLYDSAIDNEDDEGGNPLSFYSNIYTLHANGKTYYLAIDHSILSSSDFDQSIQTFSIRNNELINPLLIKTETGIESEIFVEYDFSSKINESKSSGKEIKYLADKKIIYLPLVLENGKITDEYIRYQFKGKYFEKMH